MKKYLTFCLVVFCILCGCAALKGGSVSNNIFSSPGAPKIQIKVGDAFSYLGDVSVKREQEGYGGDAIILKGGTHSYIFAMTEGIKVKRAILIEIKHTEGYFLDFYTDTKGTIEHGECKLGGKNYRYITYVANWRNHPIEQYILKKEYIMPELMLMKAYSRVLARNDTLFTIICLEDFSNYYDNDLAAWIGEKPLTPDQQKAFSRFNENCMKSFTILQ